MRQKTLMIVFICCFMYWIYLFFNTSMAVIYDAEIYQRLGVDISEKGWAYFFQGGPQREPLYPATIAFSLAVQKFSGIDYQSVQKIIQLLCLFITQLTVLKLSRLWGLRQGMQALLIFMIGFSPALLNAALSLYSEILIVPMVCGIVLGLYQLSIAVQEKTLGSAINNSLVLACLFLMAIGVKALFEIVFYALLLIFVVFILVFFLSKKWNWLQKTGVSFLILLIIGVGGITGYKYINYFYNGHYAITDRGPDLFFGNAYKRTHELTTSQWLAHLAAIPGEGMCAKFFPIEQCQYTGFMGADLSRGQQLREALGAHAAEKNNAHHIYQAAFERIKQHPFQYALLSWMETLKMFFWESTSVGFVNYPEPIAAIYNMDILSNFLRGGMGLLTLAACFYQILFILKSFRCNGMHALQQYEVVISLMIMFVIILYVGLYGLFSVLVRFALVLGPLYLLCIIKWLQRAALRRNI